MTKLQVSAMRGDTLPNMHVVHISHKKILSESQETEFKMRSSVPSVVTTIHSEHMLQSERNAKSHFAKVCRPKQVLTVKGGQQGRTPEPSSSEIFFVSSIDFHHKDFDWIEKLTLPKSNLIYFKLDTGAQCKILSSLIAQIYLITTRDPKPKVLVSLSKDSVPVLGEADVKVFTKRNTPHLVILLIVDKGHQCILGRRTYGNLCFIKRIETAIFDGEVFNGIGCLKGLAYEIDLLHSRQC
ncbi:hypothetical protein PR048_020049 [Dryococelus australis]|uniref:Peptidase A2 domain-containing protein n=1 Tax=Dryococelus australis TaxID=614101 RepID=A0ABQ9H5E9_9NEOP|nr:hypothetical protein PR048_020049 [Dryococelus australis]